MPRVTCAEVPVKSTATRWPSIVVVAFSSIGAS